MFMSPFKYRRTFVLFCFSTLNYILSFKHSKHFHFQFHLPFLSHIFREFLLLSISIEVGSFVFHSSDSIEYVSYKTINRNSINSMVTISFSLSSRFECLSIFESKKYSIHFYLSNFKLKGIIRLS